MGWRSTDEHRQPTRSACHVPTTNSTSANYPTKRPTWHILGLFNPNQSLIANFKDRGSPDSSNKFLLNVTHLISDAGVAGVRVDSPSELPTIVSWVVSRGSIWHLNLLGWNLLHLLFQWWCHPISEFILAHSDCFTQILGNWRLPSSLKTPGVAGNWDFFDEKKWEFFSDLIRWFLHHKPLNRYIISTHFTLVSFNRINPHHWTRCYQT